MPDGAIPIKVRNTVTGEPAELMLHASGGAIIGNGPPNGSFAIEPGSDVDDLKNALDILSIQAEGQRGQEDS